MGNVGIAPWNQWADTNDRLTISFFDWRIPCYSRRPIPRLARQVTTCPYLQNELPMGLTFLIEEYEISGSSN
jgi:hypothetical protein